MRILIIGGTGLISTGVMSLLLELGDQAIHYNPLRISGQILQDGSIIRERDAMYSALLGWMGTGRQRPGRKP